MSDDGIKTAAGNIAADDQETRSAMSEPKNHKTTTCRGTTRERTERRKKREVKEVDVWTCVEGWKSEKTSQMEDETMAADGL